MSLTTLKDFCDIMEPVLRTGTWTNYGATPPIIVLNKGGPTYPSRRHNKNARIEIRNEPGSFLDLTFDSSVITERHNGSIAVISTDNTDRNKLKADVVNILKAMGFPYQLLSITDNIKRRNKEGSIFSIQILDC